ncbi:MAG: hypothetical protein GX606_02060, partial [Elusimicrobia bacterium]|nr:hypothetical protein [Elusimicrobiota bacterium]
VQATADDLVYEGFVSRDVQQKLSPGQDLFWIRQEGRLEVGAPVAGTVLFVGQEPEMANGMYRLRVRFEERVPQEGAMVVARIHFGTVEKVISVPVESLDMEGGHYFGWVVREGKARRVSLSVAQRDGYGAIVSEGLVAGDLFVVGGSTFLQENDLVMIVKNKEQVL